MPDRDDWPAEELPAPAPSGISPDRVRSFRSQLTKGEDVVDPTTWAGSIPQVKGIAPRVRIGRSRWFNLLWLLPIGFVVLIVAVAAAKGLRNMPSVERFIVRYPGTIETASATASPGLPVWVGIQHFFNLFLLIFIIRSGLQILSDHPRLYWTRTQHPWQGLVPHPEAGSWRAPAPRIVTTPMSCTSKLSSGPT